MNLPRFALRRPAVVVAFVLVMGCWGLFNFVTMARRENPAIRIRICIVRTRWPGAPTTKVEELVTDPIEKKLAEIAEIRHVSSESRTGFSKIEVELDEHVQAIDQLWDEVRNKVAEVSLPDGCGAPFVDSDFGDVYDVCLALYQTPPPGGWTPANERYRYGMRRLEQLAERIEDDLKLVPEVSTVDFWGVPDERIYVGVDPDAWAKVAMTVRDLATIMEARNIVAPGGEVETERSRFSVRPSGEFLSDREIGLLSTNRLDGRLPVRLGQLPVTVERGYEDPLPTLVRYTDPAAGRARAVVIGASMKDGGNIVDMGDHIAARVRHLVEHVLPPDVAVRRINDLPRQTATIVSDFALNLGQAILIVLGLSFLIVGWRPGLVMATAVPLSMLAALAVVRYLGVELEQFSIASLIIALGLVVDNATVVTENAMRMMEEGKSRRDAVIAGAHGLAVPVLAATLTTVAAFLPMLTIAGNNGEYIRSLPVVVTATLVASYLVAMLVTPLMCFWLLDREALRRRHEARAPRKGRLLAWCLAHKGVVLGGALAAFLASLMLTRVIGSQFFPDGDRDQFFVKVWLPEGAPLSATRKVCDELEAAIVETAERDGTQRLAHMVSFIGTHGPRLMLTENLEQNYPYYARLVVTTTHSRHARPWVAELKERVAAIPGARIDLMPYEYGPPLRRPVGFRLSGEDAAILRAGARDMLAVMRSTPGAELPWSDWGSSSYQVEVKVDADAANLAGITNADVAFGMHALLSGAQLTTYREGDHQIPVVLRTAGGSRFPLADLSGIFVNGASGKVPLASFATLVPTWQPAVIARRDNKRTVTLGCRVADGVLPNVVAARMKPKLQAIVDRAPAGYRLEEAGEKEKTTESQRKIGSAFLVAFLLIVLVLVTQYNSFGKPLVILLTLPLALIGVLIGLFVTGWAMGFMAMLGILSLAGIVINDAIVLIDFLEEDVAAGRGVREAAINASRVRTKPIVLTSLTTIGGLLPLSLFGGPLWAPLSNGMIFGLVFSTGLTLVIVPTLYVLFVERFGMRTAR